MNCLSIKSILPKYSFPWFEESNKGRLCKVYADGSHYVASQVFPPRKTDRSPRFKTSFDEEFDRLYFSCLKSGLRCETLKRHLMDSLSILFPDDALIENKIDEKIRAKKHNLYARKKRFRRKALLNEWNYFVTFTYSDDLHDEDSFKRSLRKCLSNLHTRRGWKYMGVFERAPQTGRLHFHGLFYVPKGEMIGELIEKHDYSKKHHKRVLTVSNSFFDNRFGRSDFSSIDSFELKNGQTLNYILKYIEKSDERIIYSRGIPTEFFLNIYDDDISAEMFDFVLKFVLYDDVVESDECDDTARDNQISDEFPQYSFLIE